MSRARLVAATLVLATALPSTLHLVIAARLRRAEASIGEDVRIGGAEVGLSGTVALSDVRVGTTIAADTVEAAVGLSHLLAGRFVADEVRVERPRVIGGRDDLAALLERFARRRHHSDGTTTAAPRSFRIILTGGEVELDVGPGRVRARDVELHPQEGGVRVVAGKSSAEFTHGAWRAEVGFARAGVDLDLPSLRVRRAALDGGSANVSAGGEPLAVSDLVVVVGPGQGDGRASGTLPGGGKLSLARDADGVRVEASELPLAPFPAVLPAWIEGRGRVGGTAELATGGRVTAALHVEGASLAHPLVSTVALPFTGRVELRGAWDGAARTAKGQVRLGMERLVLEADLDVSLDENGAPRRAAVSASLPETPCADVLASVPRELSAPLVGLDLLGDLAGHLDVGFDLEHPDEARLAIDLDMGCRVARDESAADVARLLGPFAHQLPDGQTRVLGPEDPDFVELADLPRHVWGAFVAAEDARFFSHSGFDAEQLQRSFTIDVAAGRVERGGSTISQQLVKNLFLTHERTLGRKLVEAALTWNLEQRVGKKRILEAYLNVIELGDGVYGIGPAARRWFGKSAARLTPAEAAFLAAVTPAPRTAERTLGHAGRIDDAFARRGEIVLHAMRRASLFARDEMGHELAALEKLRLRVL